MQVLEFFPTEHKYFEIEGIDTFLRFARYDPDLPDIFLQGLELSEDLSSQFGTVLYTKGTYLSTERVSRLIKLRENNPNIDFTFKIERSSKLIETFRKDVKEHIISLLSCRLKTGAFENLLSQLDQNIETFIDEILSDESITLALYKFRFMRNTISMKKSDLFLEHSIGVALVSLSIASSSLFKHIVKNDRSFLVDVIKTSLLHNYGALSDIENILNLSPDKWFQSYWIANQEALEFIENLRLSEESIQAIRMICKVYTERRNFFIAKYDRVSTMANIVLVADVFLRRESGLFGDPMPMRRVVDQLNVKVAEKRLNEIAVRALTMGLNLLELFDFYNELDKLTAKCPYSSAVPYPLVGFRSATLYVCKKTVRACKNLETNTSAVNLVKPIGVLKPGKYYRCHLLTNLLNHFYENHYRDIKYSVRLKNSNET